MDRAGAPRLLAWWQDDPADPGRPALTHPDVQRLVAVIAPDSPATDLGGTMSLNVHLPAAGLVLRVHDRFITKRRILAEQTVRRRLSDLGLTVAVALPWQGTTVVPCGRRWAELEGFLPHAKPVPSPEAYAWLFGAMGTLHRALRSIASPVPRPLIATYAPPGSLRRWLPRTEAAVREDREANVLARITHDLVNRLRRHWIPATRLPSQLVHGDVRLGNLRRAPDGETAYLDFGFLARRPRVHDVAYALAWMLLALDGCRSPERFAWPLASSLLEAYETAAGSPLTDIERQALTPFTVAVALYHAVSAGYTNDPAGQLRERAPFLRLSQWLLEHPGVLAG